MADGARQWPVRAWLGRGWGVGGARQWPVNGPSWPVMARQWPVSGPSVARQGVGGRGWGVGGAWVGVAGVGHMNKGIWYLYYYYYVAIYLLIC